MNWYFRSLRNSRKGVVALWVAVSAPALMAVIGLGVQASQYAAARSQLQTASDAAAFAGATALGAPGGAQSAANVAANVAEINGVAGSADRKWRPDSNTLVDHDIIVAIGPGVTSAANTAVTVTVSRNINGAFAMLLGGAAKQVITATATADASPGASGGQPCLLALGTDSNAINMTGNTQVTGHNCTMRSNGGVRMVGSGLINVSAIYAGGSVSTTGSTTIIADQHENAGTIADPFEGYAPLQTALQGLNPGAGTRFRMTGSNRATINPGTYSSMRLTGFTHLTLNPGLYVVNGDISFTGSSQITGTGVTIITSGSVRFTGSTRLHLSAPNSGSTSGGVPGVLIASTSTSGSTVTGSTGMPITGLIYTPNAALTFTGSSGVNGCTEVVALKIKMTGSSSTEANCDSYGLPQYGSVAGSASARLVR